MNLIDERFLTHRLRSTSTAGILCAVLALLLFGWRLHFERVWNWDLAAVAATFLVVKLSLLIYYRLTD
jgi:hypothetical protein